MALEFVSFNPIDPATDLIDALLADGISLSGLSDISFVGEEGQVSFFSGGADVIGLESGVLFTSGDANPAVTNTSSSAGTSLFTPGDSDLDAVVQSVFDSTTNDATSLEFSFEINDPDVTSVSFNLVFGSEEFPEFADDFVDIAGVLVNGENFAFFGGDESLPLSVLQANIDAGNFIDNEESIIGIEYDGVSNLLQVVADVVQGTNTIKIAIADTGDSDYDSGLFIGDFRAGESGGGGIVTPPIADDDSATTDENVAVLIDAITNDSDSDGTVVDADIVSGPINGEVSDNDDGTFTYTPDFGFDGVDSFTYVAVDDEGGTSNVATVTVTVENVPIPPVAFDDEATTDEGAPVLIDAIDNDGDSDGTIIDADIVTGPLNGMVVDNNNGTFTYTPDDGFTGEDSFTYVAEDDEGNLSNEATVTVSVDEIASPPDLEIVLVDTKTGEIIQTIEEGGEILQSSILHRSVSIGAMVPDDSGAFDDAESMQFDLNDGSFRKLESIEPFALFGDDRKTGEYFGRRDFLEDENTLEIDVFDQNKGNGDLLGTVMRNFTVVDDLEPGPDNVRIALIDAEEDVEIATLTEGSVISKTLIEGRELNIAAFVEGSPLSEFVDSMHMSLNDDPGRTENIVPYALFGDRPGTPDFFGESDFLDDGENTLSLDLFSRNKLAGENLGTFELTFDVVDDLLT